MRPFCKIILIMAVSLFGLAAQARAPRGNLVYCSYSKTGAAGLGKDYCELIADPGADPVIKVVLNEGNRFNDPTIRKEYPATTEALKESEPIVECYIWSTSTATRATAARASAKQSFSYC